MDNNTIKFLTLNNDIGERLDVILTRKLSDLTRSNIKKIIESGQVSINGHEVLSPAKKLRLNDTVSLFYNDKNNEIDKIKPSKIKLDILFEDNDLLNTSIGISTVGSGKTSVRRVFTNIAGLSANNFSSSILTFDSGNIGVGTATFDTRSTETYTGTIQPSSYWANYSWGKIVVARDQSNNFDAYTGNGAIGLTTSTIISRSKPLEFRDYAT